MPITALHNWFQKHVPDPWHMVEFVCSKAQSIALLWTELLDTSIHQENKWALLLGLATPDQIQDYVAEAVFSCIELHADYCRRVLTRTTTFP